MTQRSYKIEVKDELPKFVITRGVIMKSVEDNRVLVMVTNINSDYINYVRLTSSEAGTHHYDISMEWFSKKYEPFYGNVTITQTR